jgi:hypothetical protein
MHVFSSQTPDLFNRMLQESEHKVQIDPPSDQVRQEDAKRGTRANIVIYTTGTQPGYFTSVASIGPPRV